MMAADEEKATSPDAVVERKSRFWNTAESKLSLTLLLPLRQWSGNRAATFPLIQKIIMMDFMGNIAVVNFETKWTKIWENSNAKSSGASKGVGWQLFYKTKKNCIEFWMDISGYGPKNLKFRQFLLID